MCERSALSGFWVQTCFVKSENSVLMDLTTKSTKKLMVEPPANFPVTVCDKYIEMKLAFMGTHCTLSSKEEHWDFVSRYVVLKREQSWMHNCLRAQFDGIKMCERNVPSGFRAHSRITYSEAFILWVILGDRGVQKNARSASRLHPHIADLVTLSS